MKVTGFTIVRNALKFDYPIVESIKSILPICDEFVVLVGKSDDETLSLIQSINDKKVKIYESIWDDNLRKGGIVLSVETNKAKELISENTDWCFYIQADEVVHEKYLDIIFEEMKKYSSIPQVEGLLFKYEHFYGSYKYIADSRKWYRREIRIIRNDKDIQSWGDAQGFRKNGQKLKVKLIDAYIYHYGWVKNPYHQMEKNKSFQKLWHSDEKVSEIIGSNDLYDYSKIDSLKLFTGTHPAVMSERIKNANWNFDFDIAKKNMPLLNKILYKFEKLTGLRPFEYKNYKII
ncbi:MAG: glycosyltransferase family 2 protein [Candidatus Kapabacteria bacterium]|nr:glycosyltransferase family 2 protein [Candidatus Kapabacteria bacterium]